MLLAAHDADRFNRWQAIQSFASQMMLAALEEPERMRFDPRFFAALEPPLTEEPDHAFAAEALSIPSEQDIAREIGKNVDPDAILETRDALLRAMGEALEASLRATYDRLAETGSYSSDAKSAARRQFATARSRFW